jgi:hypothetical protein
VTSAGALSTRRVLPLYLVVFSGFVGYSLMIAIFTPLLLRSDGGILSRSVPHSENALWVTLGASALALAVCLPAAAAIISEAVTPAQQGSALGSNQSLQASAVIAAISIVVRRDLMRRDHSRAPPDPRSPIRDLSANLRW